MTGASATSPVEVDPDVDPPPEGADDSLALLSARCIAECERRERRIASRGTHTLAGRIIYDYSSPPPHPDISRGRTPENTDNKLSSCSLKSYNRKTHENDAAAQEERSLLICG
jgi:hypothetical protein